MTPTITKMRLANDCVFSAPESELLRPGVGAIVRQGDSCTRNQ